jgi:hypothetical protein
MRSTGRVRSPQKSYEPVSLLASTPELDCTRIANDDILVPGLDEMIAAAPYLGEKLLMGGVLVYVAYIPSDDTFPRHDVGLKYLLDPCAH